MFHTIECAQLDFDDTTFLMSYPLAAAPVIASVATVGVIQPIIVTGCPCQGKYKIIAGFRRAHACRELGLETVHVNVYPLDPEQLLCGFSLALYENMAHRTFNDVEKSIILSKLLNQFGCSRDDVIRNYLPTLQLAPHDKVLQAYLSLAAFEDNLKQYLAAHDVPMSVVELLAALPPEDRQALFQLLSSLKLGVNKLKEILTLLDELALRDQRTIHAVLAEPDIQKILTHSALSGPQKTDQLRQYLRQQRYPQLTVLETEYQEQIKRLRLSKTIRLSTDRFFEDDAFTVSTRFETPEQLQAVAEELSQLSQSPDLQKLLTLIQG